MALLARSGSAPDALAAPAAVDTPTALARLGGNGALYGRILKNFLAEVVAMPQRIEALLAEGQPQQSANVLHTLKGLAGTVGAMALARQASDWEATLKQANGATPAEGLVPALRHAIEAVQAPLAQAVAAFSPPEEARTGPGVAADLVAGLAILRQLRELLAVGDAGALDAHRGLAEALGPAHAAAVAELGHAIAAFDFPQGLAQCEALAASLAGQGQDAADEETA